MCKSGWDDEKSRHNEQTRGFDFGFASGIFRSGLIETVDDRFDYGEMCKVALGEVAGLVLVVVCTDRDGMRRIISARFASRKERALWAERFE